MPYIEAYCGSPSLGVSEAWALLQPAPLACKTLCYNSVNFLCESVLRAGTYIDNTNQIVDSSHSPPTNKCSFLLCASHSINSLSQAKWHTTYDCLFDEYNIVLKWSCVICH